MRPRRRDQSLEQIQDNLRERLSAAIERSKRTAAERDRLLALLTSQGSAPPEMDLALRDANRKHERAVRRLNRVLRSYERFRAMHGASGSVRLPRPPHSSE